MCFYDSFTVLFNGNKYAIFLGGGAIYTIISEFLNLTAVFYGFMFINLRLFLSLQKIVYPLWASITSF